MIESRRPLSSLVSQTEIASSPPHRSEERIFFDRTLKAAGDVIAQTALPCHFSIRKTLLHRSCFPLILSLVKGMGGFSPAFKIVQRKGDRFIK
ncbi:hypothetical protein ETC03_13375 [Geobacillus sp. MMMUD3]|nr:hypothetical protein [Geobacillus sp. MMMUD3]